MNIYSAQSCRITCNTNKRSCTHAISFPSFWPLQVPGKLPWYIFKYLECLVHTERTLSSSLSLTNLHVEIPECSLTSSPFSVLPPFLKVLLLRPALWHRGISYTQHCIWSSVGVLAVYFQYTSLLMCLGKQQKMVPVLWLLCHYGWSRGHPRWPLARP